MPTLRSSKLQAKSLRSSTSNAEKTSASSPSEELLGGTENDMRNGYVSRTDWDAVRRMSDDDPIPYDPEDGPYDPNDEAAVDAFWDEAERAGRITVGLGKRGPQKAPTKQLVSLRLSREVLDHFRATGRGWQARIDEALKQVAALK